MNLNAHGSCGFNVQDIIIKTFVLQFIITRVTSRPALSVCLCLFQIVQLVHDFITVCKANTAVTAKGTHNLSLLHALSEIKCITLMDNLSFRIIMSSQSDRERRATPIDALDRQTALDQVH